MTARADFPIFVSTECYRFVDSGTFVKCFCGKNLQRLGAHTAAWVRPQLGSTGPQPDATSIKCSFCRTVVEISYERVE